MHEFFLHHTQKFYAFCSATPLTCFHNHEQCRAEIMWISHLFLHISLPPIGSAVES